MPTRPPRPCTTPGCPAMQPCPRHTLLRHREQQERRGTAAQRGYDARHRRWRAMVLARHPICADPDGRHPGVVVAATVADHIVPLRRGGDWSLANGQGLCESCHNAKSARERRDAPTATRSGRMYAPAWRQEAR